MANNEELRRWVLDWSSAYQEQDDADILAYEGRAAYVASEFRILFRWKLDAQPDIGTRLANLDEIPHNRTVDLTARAFSCPDDLGALLILCELDEVDVVVASAVLAAARPNHWLNCDQYSLASLRDGLGLLSAGSDQPTTRDWLPFLRVTRQLAARTELNLRTVDRALRRARPGEHVGDATGFALS